MTTGNLQQWRRLAAFFGAAVVVSLPFLKIKGESALRFDIPALQLHFFGTSIWMEEFFIVLIGIIFLSFLFISMTLLFGRIWCGWACPQTVLSDITASVERYSGKGFYQRIISYAAVFVLSLAVGANLIWYFVSPYDFFPALAGRHLGSVVWAFWVTLSLIIFLDLSFLRQRFCATVCPYSMLQGALFDESTLTVAFDPRRKEECIDCKACVRACPVGIDIRQGENRACIHCAKCIDECRDIMGKKQKETLIDYCRGLPGGTGNLLRKNTVMFGAATLLSLLFVCYLLFTRLPYDLTVLPNYSFHPRATADGMMTNSYILSIKNRGMVDKAFKVMAAGFAGRIRIVPEEDIFIKAGEIKKIPAYVTVAGDMKERLPQTIDISVAPAEESEFRLTRTANFIFSGE
ncbi:MAG: FixG Ig-like domain-containing protein [Thermodesulfovibrionia bacterium]|nr:FixG Ig-like domain-containing protein [Thermodesulfovibrionia bacterium]